MSAYVIAHYDIIDADGYAPYGAAAGPSVFKFGGEVLAAGPNAVAREGGQPDNALILKFPSVDAAQQWYDSEDYQSALPHRLNHVKNNTLLILPEFTMPS